MHRQRLKPGRHRRERGQHRDLIPETTHRFGFGAVLAGLVSAAVVSLGLALVMPSPL